MSQLKQIFLSSETLKQVSIHIDKDAWKLVILKLLVRQKTFLDNENILISGYKNRK